MRDIPHWILSNYRLTTLLFTSQTIQTSAMSNPHITAGSHAIFEADNGHEMITQFDNCQHPASHMSLLEAYPTPYEVSCLLSTIGGRQLTFHRFPRGCDLCWSDFLGCQGGSSLAARFDG